MSDEHHGVSSRAPDRELETWERGALHLGTFILPRELFDIRRFTTPAWKLLGEDYVRIASIVADRCALRWDPSLPDVVPSSKVDEGRHRESERRRISPRAFEQFFNAWVGLSQRIVSADEHAAAFRAAYQWRSEGTARSGGAAGPIEVQVPFDEDHPDAAVMSALRPAERHLFDCVVNAYSALEALFHAVYIVVGFVRPSSFPSLTENDLRRISPPEVMKRLRAPDGLPAERLTKVARHVLGDKDIGLLQDVRNSLVHRGTPIGLGQYLQAETGRPFVRLTSESRSGPIDIDALTGSTVAFGARLAALAVISELAVFADRRL